MTTYSISLDDVDLALLPARAGHNNFLRREHYEFQVLAREDEDSLQTSHPCHICAIDVPAAFWSEHRAGAKHRANARIATTAAHRTSALITASPPPPLQPSGTFCDSCTIIAGKDHEKTKEHRISVIHDRMLCDLANIYTGEDVDGEEIVKGGLANEHVKNDNKDVKETRVDAVNNMTETELNDVKNNQTNTAKVLEDNTKSMKAKLPNEDAVNNNQNDKARLLEDNTTKMKADLPKENGAQETHPKKIDNKTYIQLLNIPSFPKIQIQTCGNLIQILVNNEKINVSSDNFHSYYRLGSKIQCRACCQTIDAAEEETHKLSMIHMKRIMQVVEDSHCIRTIYTNWSHCILCNQVINNKIVDSHKLSMFHCDRKAVCTVPTVTTEDVMKVNKPTGSTTGNFQENKPNEIQNGGADAKNAGVEAKNAGVEAKNAGIEGKNAGVQAKTAGVQAKNAGVQAKNAGVQAKNAGVQAKATAAQNNNAGGPSNFKNAANQNGQGYKSNNMTVYKSKEDSKIEYPYKATEDLSSVYCVVCKCQVPNKLSNRSDHLKGARHASSMKNIKQ